MTNINSTNLRNNLFSILDNTIKYNDVVNVNTKNGNAVILSEADYIGLLVTLELITNQKLNNKIIQGKNENIENCINIDEVKW